MSHELEMLDDDTASMAYVGETPWHGLGTKVEANISVDEMLAAANLDWEVRKTPLKTYISRVGAPPKMIPVPDHFALVRDRDDVALGVVGKRWKPLQNRDAFTFFKSFVEDGGATMETAGSLFGGRKVWGLANLGTSFRLKDGDEVKGYLLLMSPHEQGKSIIVRLTTVRVVCNNTLTLAVSGTSEIERRFSHRVAFEPDAAAASLEIVRENFSEFERNARLLEGLNLSRAEVIYILAPVYQPETEPVELVKDEDMFGLAMKRVMDSYVSAPGAIQGTGWGVLNAVTHYVDFVAAHHAKRAGADDRRLDSAWLGIGSKQKEKVLSSLLELV